MRWTGWLVVVGLVLGVATLSYCGFCFGTFQFLSDDDAINAAIDDVLTLRVHAIEAGTGETAWQVSIKDKIISLDEVREDYGDYYYEPAPAVLPGDEMVYVRAKKAILALS